MQSSDETQKFLLTRRVQYNGATDIYNMSSADGIPLCLYNKGFLYSPLLLRAYASQQEPDPGLNEVECLAYAPAQ